MKMIVQKNLLLENVQTASNIVPVRPSVYLLTHILIEADSSSGKVTISGTNLEISIATTFQCSVEESGSITVPGKKLNEILRSFDDADIELIAENDNLEIKGKKSEVKGKRSTFNLRGQPKDDFPSLPKVKKESTITLDQDVFKNMLRRIIFAAPTDDSRQCLNGGYLNLVNQDIILVATDGHRLAMTKTESTITFKKESGVIIPTKVLIELSRIIKGNGDLTISYSENQMLFEIGQTVLICRLIEENYPNYEQVIPKEQDYSAIVDRTELLSVSQQAFLMVVDRSNSVKYKFSNGTLSLFSISPELGQVDISLPIDYEGEEVQVSLNAQYIINVLKNIDTESIEIKFSNKLSPVVICPAGSDDYLCLIMPMRQ